MESDQYQECQTEISNIIGFITLYCYDLLVKCMRLSMTSTSANKLNLVKIPFSFGFYYEIVILLVVIESNDMHENKLVPLRMRNSS